MIDRKSTALSIILPLLGGLLKYCLVRPGDVRNFARRLFNEAKIAGSAIHRIHLDDIKGISTLRIVSNLSASSLVGLVAKAMGAKQVFEFGTYRGETAVLIAENCPECRIVTIDLPDGTSYETAQQTVKVEMTDQYLFQTNSRGQVIIGEPAKRITQIREDSADFDEAPYLSRFDLIYVDASHSYSAVKSDTQKALKMLRPGGVIIWDDYLYPGVWRYLNELSEENPTFQMRYISESGKVILLGDQLKLN